MLAVKPKNTKSQAHVEANRENWNNHYEVVKEISEKFGEQIWNI